MASVAVRISNLNPFLGVKIKGSDIVPINVLNLDGVTYSTFKATALQIRNYVADTITDQSLLKSSSVQFNSLTSTLSISSARISATNLYGDGSNLTNVFNQSLNTNNNVKFNTLSATNGIKIGEQSVASKYTTTLNHVGNVAEQVYTINHPFVTIDVLVQLYEITNNGLVESTSKVIASIVNTVDTNNGVTAVTIANKDSATYKAIILG